MEVPQLNSKRQAGAVLVGLFLAVFLQVWDRYEPNTFIRRDGSFYATISMGLVERFSLDQREIQPQSWYSGTHPGYANLDAFWSNVSLGQKGAWYPKHSFLISVAAAPFYASFGVFGFLLFNALCVVAMLWAGYLIAARYAPPAAAALAVLLTALSPMVVEHTYHLSADIFNAALVALGSLALIHTRPAWAGILLGLALWSRPVTAVLVFPVMFALIWGRFDRAKLMRLCIALSIPLALAAVTNTLMYGAPWVTSYDRVLTVRNRTQEIVSARELYTNTFEAGLRLMFENREHGLIAHALPSLAALIGIIPLWRHARALAVALAVGMVGFVGTYVFYRYFHARFFFAWEILLCVPLAVLMSDCAALGLRVAERLHAPVIRIRSALKQTPRWTMVALTCCVIAGTWTMHAIGQRTYVLSEHINDAHVFRNNYPCDYFNFTHLGWECSRLEGDVQSLAGIAMGQRSCEFGGKKWRALTIAAASDGGTRSMRFEHLPAGALDLEYGLRAGSLVPETCFSIAYSGQPAERVCTKDAGIRKHRRFALTAGDARTLEIAIEGTALRALCFDGVIREGT